MRKSDELQWRQLEGLFHIQHCWYQSWICINTVTLPLIYLQASVAAFNRAQPFTDNLYKLEHSKCIFDNNLHASSSKFSRDYNSHQMGDFHELNSTWDWRWSVVKLGIPFNLSFLMEAPLIISWICLSLIWEHHAISRSLMAQATIVNMHAMNMLITRYIQCLEDSHFTQREGA